MNHFFLFYPQYLADIDDLSAVKYGDMRKYLAENSDIDVKKHKALVKQLVTEAVADVAGKRTRGTKRAASAMASSLAKRMVPKIFDSRSNFSVHTDENGRSCYVMS